MRKTPGMMGRVGALAAAWLVGVATAPAGTLSGTILDDSGRPAEGATVWAAELYAPGPLQAREARSGADGRFAIEVKPGRWLAWARKGDRAGEVAHQDLPTVEEGRDPAPITIRLLDRGRLRGRLIEAETGRPIAGGRFRIDNAVALTADDQGRFEFAGLMPGNHESYVVAPGRQRRRVLFDTTLRPDAELDLRIPRGGTVAGRVLDEQGKPIPGAVVGLSTSGNTFSGTALWEDCAADGRFAWHGVTPDRPSRLTAQAPGFGSDEKDGLLVADGSGPLVLDFVLRPSRDRAAAKAVGDEARRDLTGSVVLPGGKPAAGAVVRWGAIRSDRSQETKSGADGRFRLAGVPDRPGGLVVIAEGAAPGFPVVEAGGDRDVRVELEAGETARGRVVDDLGAPLAGVSVVPTIPSPVPPIGQSVWLTERTATTDADGRFAIEGLPRFGARFDFLRRGLSESRNQALLPGGADNEVRMQAEGAIRGRVVDRDGRPIRDFRILMGFPRERRPDDPPGGGFFAGYSGIGITFTADDGVFVVTGLKAGAILRVTALAEGRGQAVLDRVAVAQVNHLPPVEEVTLSAGLPFALRVRAVEAGDGARRPRPVPRARVTLVNGEPGLDRMFSWGYHDASWEDMVRARTDAEGRADFPPLAFGEATVLVQAPGFGRRRLGWRDGSRELTVPLAPEAVVTGEVRNEDGSPDSDVHVALRSPEGDGISASIEPRDAGRFRIAELPEGTYALTVNRNFGSRMHQESVTIHPGETIERPIRLKKGAEAQASIPMILEAPKPSPMVKAGAEAPAFATKTLDGKPIKPVDYRGKFVLLDFWATWCGPCVAEIPHLKAVQDRFGKDDRFALVSLSLDAEAAEPTRFAREKGMTWTQGFLGQGANDPVSKAYGVESIPSTFLIGPDGKIIAVGLRGPAIGEAVARALGGK